MTHCASCGLRFIHSTASAGEAKKATQIRERVDGVTQPTNVFRKLLLAQQESRSRSRRRRSKQQTIKQTQQHILNDERTERQTESVRGRRNCNRRTCCTTTTVAFIKICCYVFLFLADCRCMYVFVKV